MAAESPLVEPELADHNFEADKHQMLRDKIAGSIRQLTGLRSSDRQCIGWLGLECPDIQSAIWMMRALVVSNVLSRREGTILFVAVNSATDSNGEAVIQNVARIHAFAAARNLS